MDLSAIQPTEGAGLSPRRNSRVTGPNPFLDNDWLENSYTDGKDYEVTVPGFWEEGKVTRGKRIGEPISRLRGDASTVVSLLRSAADYLGIGVAIETVPAVNARGQERKGFVTVKYLGKTRRQTKDGEEEVEETEE